MTLTMGTRDRLAQTLTLRRKIRSWRRRLLVGLLVVTLIPALWIVRRTALQLRVMSQVSPLGAKVHYRIDATNWLQGGESEVVFEPQAFLSRGSNPRELDALSLVQRVTAVDLTLASDSITDLSFLNRLPDLVSLKADRSSPYYPGWPLPDPLDARMLLQGTVLSRLENLEIPGNRVEDTDLDQLASAARLETLDLSHTAITDAGLKKLAGLPSLVYLKLDGTRVTPAGVAALQQLRPRTSIEYDPKVKSVSRDNR